MTKLKKLAAFVLSLAIILVSLPVTATVTNAATFVPKFEYEGEDLRNLELVAGMSDGTLGLSTSLNREQALALIIKYMGWRPGSDILTDAQVDNALSQFKDKDKISGWARKQVAYALINNITAGYTDGNFGPLDNVKGYQFATWMLNGMGYKPKTDYDPTKALIHLGDMEGFLCDDEDTDYIQSLNSVNLIRDDTFGIMYASFFIYRNSSDMTQLGYMLNRQIVDVLKVIELELMSEEEAFGYMGASTPTPTPDPSVTPTPTPTPGIGLIQSITPVATSGIVNKIELRFTSAMTNPGNVKVTIKRDNVAISPTATEIATGSLGYNFTFSYLSEGDYTVTVEGYAQDTLTQTFKIYNTSVAKSIDILSNTAFLKLSNMTQATVNYKITNYYGEDITNRHSPLFNVTSNDVGMCTSSFANGVLTITVPTGSSRTFTTATVFQIVAILTQTSADPVNVQKSLTVSTTMDLAVFSLEPSLYHLSGKTPTAGDTAADFYILVNAKRSDGTSLVASDLNDTTGSSSQMVLAVVTGTAAITTGINTSNSTSVSGNPIFEDIMVNDVKRLAIRLKSTDNKLAGGTLIVQLMYVLGDKRTEQVTYNIKSAQALNRISFVPSGQIASGEINTIPIYAYDQDGALLTTVSSVVSGLSGGALSSTYGTVSVVSVSSGLAVQLNLTAQTLNQSVTGMITGVTTSGQMISYTYTIVPARVPSTFKQFVGGFPTDLVLGSTFYFDRSYIEYYDQYGGTMVPELGSNKYNIKFTSSNYGILSLNKSTTYTLSNTSDRLIVAAEASGTVVLTMEISQNVNGNWQILSNCTKTWNIYVENVSSIVSLSVDAIKDMYMNSNFDGTDNGAGDLKVYGVTSSGKKYLLPSNMYTVHFSNYSSFISIGKDANNTPTGKIETRFIDGTAPFADSNTQQVTEMFFVQPNFQYLPTVAASSPVTFVIKRAKPTISSITVQSGDNSTYVSSTEVRVNVNLARQGLNAIIGEILKVTSNYGTTISMKSATVLNDYLTVFIQSKPANRSDTLSDIQAGDVFTINVFAKNGTMMGQTVVIQITVYN